MIREKGNRVQPGDVFGRLTVVHEAENRGYNKYWKCLCYCGRHKIVYQGSLTRGATGSCGCLQKETVSEANIKDLTGMVFGRLTVLSLGGPKNGKVFWTCQCSCGNIKSVNGQSLLRRRSKSCGCLSRELAGDRARARLIGQKFGYYTVLSLVGTTKTGSLRWLCRCDCGNERVVTSSKLLSGGSKSCGCTKKEKVGELHPNWNGSLTDEERSVGRNISGYSSWRSAVYHRDNYTCQICGARGLELNAHHIESYNKNKSIRLEVSNGVTLCSGCHKKFHSVYGRGNNSRIQYDSFLAETPGTNKTE